MEGAAESSGAPKRDARGPLQGSNALVTGGSEGIGHAVVEALARLGASVFTCSRNGADLARCQEQWEAMGFLVTTSICDISSGRERETLMGNVASAFDGKLDILVNDVGTCINQSTVDYTPGDFSFLTATSLDSAFHLCQLSHPLFKASGAGSVVFISPSAGWVHVPDGSIYVVAKGAMNQLTSSLACECAKDNIQAATYEKVIATCAEKDITNSAEPAILLPILDAVCNGHHRGYERGCGLAWSSVTHWGSVETTQSYLQYVKAQLEAMHAREREKEARQVEQMEAMHARKGDMEVRQVDKMEAMHAKEKKMQARLEHMEAMLSIHSPNALVADCRSHNGLYNSQAS